MEGDGRQSDHIVDERDGRVSQSGDGIVPVPRIPGLVRSGTPIKIEEEIRLGSNLSTRFQRGTVGREGGDRLREACRGRVYLRGGANKPQASQATLVAYKSRQRRETGFPVQTSRVGGGKTVGDPPTDPTPKDGHWVHDGWGGAPNSRPVKENPG